MTKNNKGRNISYNTLQRKMSDYFPDPPGTGIGCGSYHTPTGSPCKTDALSCPVYPIPACYCDPDDYIGNQGGADLSYSKQKIPSTLPCRNFSNFSLRGQDDTPKSINTTFLNVSKPIYNNANRPKTNSQPLAELSECRIQNPSELETSCGGRGRPVGITDQISRGGPTATTSSERNSKLRSRGKKSGKVSKSRKSSRTSSKMSKRRRKSPRPLSLSGSKKDKRKSLHQHRTSGVKSPKKTGKISVSYKIDNIKSQSSSLTKSRGRSKTKDDKKKSGAKNNSSSRSSAGSNTKTKDIAKGKETLNDRKKSRGRSKVRSMRTKPRGPPPTPVSIDEKKKKIHMLTLLEKFNKHIMHTGLGSEDNSKINLYRGYNSEPELQASCNIKFPAKERKKMIKGAKKSKSLNEICIDKKGYPRLMIPHPYSDEDFKEISVSSNVWQKWQEYFELENQSYTFYDELYAKKYVTDSMEVPGNSDDISYLIEADDKDYRAKIDYGRIVLKTKHVYTGNFVEWYFQGPGRYVWLDGSVYQGDFVNGVMHGEGTLLWPNGCIYEGQFRQGVRGGFGVYTTSQGYIYSGDWLHGFPNGKGKVWYDPVNNPGNFYEGELVKGFPHGFGVRSYKTGDRYAGYWANGQREGQGTMFWKDQKQMYKGQWLKGLAHGEGIQAWFTIKAKEEPPPDTTKKHHSHHSHHSTAPAPTGHAPSPLPPPLSFSRHIFKGNWEKGERHGIGRMYYPNGSVYEGKWEFGKQVGGGTLTDPAGELLTGLDCSHAEHSGFMDDIFDRSTCECLFSRLLTAIYKKLPVKMCDVRRKDERELTKLCFDNMYMLRLMYQRAVDLGTMWSNFTLSTKASRPCKPPQKCFLPPNDFLSDFGNDPSIFSKFNLIGAHNNTHFATRFGLWLLIKDFKKVGKDVCLTTLDESWASMPSIAFQTLHSPFETVHFWQFIQCLVVLAFEFHVVIPFENSRAKHKCRLEKEETDVGATKIEDKIINSNLDSLRSRSRQPSKNSSGSRKRGSKERHKRKSRGKKLSNIAATGSSLSNPKRSKIDKSILHVQLSDDEFIDVPKQEEGTIARNTSEVLQTDDQTETDFEDLQRQDSSEDDIYTSFPSCHESVCMTEVMSGFLSSEVIPCFSTVAGKHLPQIPSTLPPIRDLFEMFKSIKDKDVITASDFLYSVLPHRVYPVSYHNPIYWNRVNEILSAKVDYDSLFSYVKAMETETWESTKLSVEQSSENDKSKESNSDNIKNNVQSEKSAINVNVDINNNNQVQVSSTQSFGSSLDEAIKYCHPQKQKKVMSTIVITDKDLAPIEETKKKSPLYDENGLPVLEFELLTPDTYQPSNDLPYEQIKLEKPRTLRNLQADEVVGVIRSLYPRLCGQLTETNLQFQMLFCDWLWCIILCTQLSIQKEKEVEGRVKSNVFQLPNSKNIIQPTNTDRTHCCHSKKLNDDKFFQEHILNVFYKHQDLRKGEKWINKNSPSAHSYQNVKSKNLTSRPELQKPNARASEAAKND